MAKQVILTAEGIKQLEDELEYLKVTKRKEITEKIKEARSYGDLSENAEYDAAKEAQATMEQRVTEIENMLKNAVVAESDDSPEDVVSFGSTVKIHDVEFDEDAEYTIVGSSESDPVKGKISNESPIGKALLSSKIGDTVSAETPGGTVELKILDITK